jgi:uncharacterized protein (DUF58 family)
MPISIDRQKTGNFGSLEFRARQEVEGFITGLHKSPYHGFSVEFAEHRAYNKGESTRHIDWKLYAKTEKFFIKKYEEETNLRCQIVIDDSSSMYYPENPDYSKNKFDKIGFSVYAAASLIRLMQKQRDAVGLSVFDDKIELHLEPKSNNLHIHRLYQNLEELINPEKSQLFNKKSFAVSALHEIAERIHKRSLVIIFSDLMDNSDSDESIFEALQHLRYYKHDVVLFGVFDSKFEINLDFENRPRTFVDRETGEKIKLNPISVKDFYRENMTRYIHDLEMKCGQYEIDFVQCDVNEGFYPILLQYLVKRQRLY